MIRIELDVMLARRKMTLTELSRRLDIALPNLSILKNGHAEYSARDCAARPLKLSIHSGGIEHACRRR